MELDIKYLLNNSLKKFIITIGCAVILPACENNPEVTKKENEVSIPVIQKQADGSNKVEYIGQDSIKKQINKKIDTFFYKPDSAAIWTIDNSTIGNGFRLQILRHHIPKGPVYVDLNYKKGIAWEKVQELTSALYPPNLVDEKNGDYKLSELPLDPGIDFLNLELLDTVQLYDRFGFIESLYFTSIQYYENSLESQFIATLSESKSAFDTSSAYILAGTIPDSLTLIDGFWSEINERGNKGNTFQKLNDSLKSDHYYGKEFCFNFSPGSSNPDSFIFNSTWFYSTNIEGAYSSLSKNGEMLGNKTNILKKESYITTTNRVFPTHLFKQSTPLLLLDCGIPESCGNQQELAHIKLNKLQHDASFIFK